MQNCGISDKGKYSDTNNKKKNHKVSFYWGANLRTRVPVGYSWSGWKIWYLASCLSLCPSGSGVGLLLRSCSSLHLGCGDSGSRSELHHDRNLLWAVCDGSEDTCRMQSDVWDSLLWLSVNFVMYFLFLSVLRVFWTWSGLVSLGCCWLAPSPSHLHCWSPFFRTFIIWRGWTTSSTYFKACRSVRAALKLLSCFKEHKKMLTVIFLLTQQLPFALIPILTFTSLTSIMNDFANGL